MSKRDVEQSPMSKRDVEHLIVKTVVVLCLIVVIIALVASSIHASLNS